MGLIVQSVKNGIGSIVHWTNCLSPYTPMYIDYNQYLGYIYMVLVSSVSLSADKYLIVIFFLIDECTRLCVNCVFRCIFYDGICLLTIVSCTRMYVYYNKYLRYLHIMFQLFLLSSIYNALD